MTIPHSKENTMKNLGIFGVIPVPLMVYWVYRFCAAAWQKMTGK